MPLVDLALIRKYNVNGPRYTSYPTALQFSEFTPADYTRAVTDSPRRDSPISLYFHLPFCSTLCYYCACSKIVTRDKAKGVRYLEYLNREIDLQAPNFAGRKVTQLHWGGGTPTFLSDEQITDLMDTIRDRFELVSDSEGEFSIEIDPRTVDAARIRHIREAGFNRLSLGIQDFEPDVQKAVNRIQSFEATREVIQAARDVGFKSISVDLIYGLPHQTMATIANTLKQVIELSPDRISIYNYAHLPQRFAPQKRINVVDLPDADHKLRILKQCIDMLTVSGYQYIGMDHFAKPDDELAVAQREGTLHRNFQGYSTHADCDLVAMGITGISNIGNTYSQNAKTMEDYEAALDGGRLPIVKGIQIDADDLIRKAVIMALICQFTVSFETIEREFDIDFRKYFWRELDSFAAMENDGLVEIDDKGIQVTERGRLLIRNVCMAFDRHLNPDLQANSYSRAI
ncbi:MAG TPA: oxygen-independent coproporphyrinogen III oxidase [Pseudomonadales bacterium]|nr:oxygen-independent coproporphyrinogen III oxidase [Pseudomonadales bacterium]